MNAKLKEWYRIGQVILWICASGPWMCHAEETRVSVCDILNNPKEFHDGSFVVMGTLVYTPVETLIVCHDKRLPEIGSALNVVFDFERIEQDSPQYVPEIKSDIKHAKARTAGAIRTAVVKCRVRFCDAVLQGKGEVPLFGGFGFASEFPGEIVVVGVLECGRNTWEP